MRVRWDLGRRGIESYLSTRSVEGKKKQMRGGEDCGLGFPVVETRGQNGAMGTNTHPLHLLPPLGQLEPHWI